ncbi:MAG: ABC transporter ATP-binding protein [Chloroflexota bacterium]|nr:ABC transporter ATP-binding protein [Chloroflexota bacterium]
MSLLEVGGVVSGYGEMEILHDVSIQVEKGDIVSLIGPNGAGKSTLMKTIFGLLRAWKGYVRFAGEEITHLQPEQIVRRGLCYVPQVDNIFPSLTVRENMEMGAFIRDDNYQLRMDEIYELFPDLKDRRGTRAGKLSGGMRQMVALGRALMLDPQMMLLDEPSAGLAPLVVELIFERIRAINREGVTFLIVEQNALKVLENSDQGYVLVEGRNRLNGTGRELLEDKQIGELFLGR